MHTYTYIHIHTTYIHATMRAYTHTYGQAHTERANALQADIQSNRINIFKNIQSG